MLDRSAFDKEISDPLIRSQLAALTYREVGNQGPQARQAFIETVFNRAAARGQTLAQAMSNRDRNGNFSRYYPDVSLRGTAGIHPRHLEDIDRTIDLVHRQGTNVSNLATGNASGTVGFAGGPETFRHGGERFGREGPDRGWNPTFRQVPDDVRSRLASALVSSNGVTTTQPPTLPRPMSDRSLTAFANVPKPMALGGEPKPSPPQEPNVPPFETRTVRTIPLDRSGAVVPPSTAPPQEDYRTQLASALQPQLLEGPTPAPRPQREPVNTPAQPQMRPEDRSPIMNYGLGQPQIERAQFSERPQLMDYATTLPNGTQTQPPPEWSQPTPTIKQDGMGAGWRDQPPMASGASAPSSNTNAMLAKALSGGATWSQNPFGIKWRSGGFTDLGGR